MRCRRRRCVWAGHGSDDSVAATQPGSVPVPPPKPLSRPMGSSNADHSSRVNQCTFNVSQLAISSLSNHNWNHSHMLPSINHFNLTVRLPLFPDMLLMHPCRRTMLALDNALPRPQHQAHVSQLASAFLAAIHSFLSLARRSVFGKAEPGDLSYAASQLSCSFQHTPAAWRACAFKTARSQARCASRIWLASLRSLPLALESQRPK
jgi:hypothetical protein